jgi:uncharacterized iron-regulated membrane protein
MCSGAHRQYQSKDQQAVFGAIMLFVMLLIVIVLLVLIFLSWDGVVGTECRTAGGGGDHLYIGNVNCNDVR